MAHRSSASKTVVAVYSPDARNTEIDAADARESDFGAPDFDAQSVEDPVEWADQLDADTEDVGREYETLRKELDRILDVSDELLGGDDDQSDAAPRSKKAKSGTSYHPMDAVIAPLIRREDFATKEEYDRAVINAVEERMKNGMFLAEALGDLHISPAWFRSIIAAYPDDRNRLRRLHRGLRGRGNTRMLEPHKRKFVELVSNGYSISEAARALRIGAKVIREYMYRDPDFAMQVAEAEAAACYVIEDTLYRLAKSGNFQAIKFWLVNRAPDRWSDGSKRGSHSDIIPIQVNVNNMFDDIDQLARQYAEKFRNAVKSDTADSSTGGSTDSTGGQ